MDLKIFSGAAAAVLLMSAPAAFAQDTATDASTDPAAASTTAAPAGDTSTMASTDATGATTTGVDPSAATTPGLTTTAGDGEDEDGGFPWGLLGLLGLAGLLGLKRKDDTVSTTTSTGTGLNR